MSVGDSHVVEHTSLAVHLLSHQPQPSEASAIKHIPQLLPNLLQLYTSTGKITEFKSIK